MKVLHFICLIIMIATLDLAAAESLERRFGPDRQRGHRSEREFEGTRDGFKNRDRANFLGVEQKSHPEASVIHPDLHHSPRIGLQR
ncbi:hypothetical protein AB7714_30070 [Tardiphaga sp. 1201_B9_N1_1]|uniref:hypothetical protein n=1 Tax=unclassified Tardiphaga TaxID=2631404 RepID=UPI003F201F57